MPQLIFVTGASGFLGSHIVHQLLEQGYRVRAAARGPKVAGLEDAYAKHKDQFEAVAISDIVNDQFPELLRGVDAVIHSASPLAGRAEPEDMLRDAIEGSLNVIRQAEKAGIKKIVVTSSIASVNNPQDSFTDKDWNPVTREQALKADNPMVTYSASKTLAERAVWEFADSHPDLEITTLNPSFLYGPFTEAQSLSSPNYSALSTNLYIYRLLDPSGVYPPSASHADVRDAARAHVLALKSPPTSSVGRKRLPFSSPHGLDFKAVVEYIAEKRPELKNRLIAQKVPEYPYDRIPIDFERVEEVLGLKKSEFQSWEATILDSVDSLLRIEKEWVSKGYTIEIPK